jgi:glucose/mannose-6-phosphate isomerase
MEINFSGREIVPSFEKIKQLSEKFDRSGMLHVLAESHTQIAHTIAQPFNLSADINPGRIKNILVCGMGGSAISADALKECMGSLVEVPYFVNRNYTIPRWTGRDTLVIASSYSGNNEETIEALNSALDAGAMPVIITTGGSLAETAVSRGIPCFSPLKGYQPRFAFYSSLFALAKVFSAAGIIPPIEKLAEEAAALLKTRSAEYSGAGSAALRLAYAVYDKYPLICGCGGITGAAAARLKGQLNENSKMHSFYSTLPEMNHNEITAWNDSEENRKHFIPVFLSDPAAHPRILRRIEITAELFRSMKIDPVIISSGASSLPLRILDQIYLSDWTSCYAAFLRECDPALIANIDYVKSRI